MPHFWSLSALIRIRCSYIAALITISPNWHQVIMILLTVAPNSIEITFGHEVVSTTDCDKLIWISCHSWQLSTVPCDMFISHAMLVCNRTLKVQFINITQALAQPELQHWKLRATDTASFAARRLCVLFASFACYCHFKRVLEQFWWFCTNVFHW